MVLDSSAAPGAVDLEVLARGPIGKYAFSLQGARVQGMRIYLNRGMLCTTQARRQPRTLAATDSAVTGRMQHRYFFA
jgi:hypothetical protein